MKSFLQLLGLRTTCCNARILTWYQDKHYCAQCERWLDKPESAAPLMQGKPSKNRTRISG